MASRVGFFVKQKKKLKISNANSISIFEHFLCEGKYFNISLATEGMLPVYDNNMSKIVIFLEQFNTFSNANTRRNHIHIEYIFEVFGFTLCKMAIKLNWII